MTTIAHPDLTSASDDFNPYPILGRLIRADLDILLTRHTRSAAVHRDGSALAVLAACDHEELQEILYTAAWRLGDILTIMHDPDCPSICPKRLARVLQRSFGLSAINAGDARTVVRCAKQPHLIELSRLTANPQYWINLFAKTIAASLVTVNDPYGLPNTMAGATPTEAR